MTQDLKRFIETIAVFLNRESATNMSKLCEKYNLGSSEDHNFSENKMKYLKRKIEQKEEDFIINLAKKIIEDYRYKDNFHSYIRDVANHLDTYTNCGYYKLPKKEREVILIELFKIGNLNGLLSISDFLRFCHLDSLFSNYESITELTLQEKIQSSAIYIIIDEDFFIFIEKIVHPEVRKSNEIEKYKLKINEYLKKYGFELKENSENLDYMTYKVCKIDSIQKKVKNIIFAANGYKPEIVLNDALSNDIKIVKNADNCLVYDDNISKPTGLLWVHLVAWWANRQEKERSFEIANQLKNRLYDSLASEPEKILFDIYFNTFKKTLGQKLPALIPQVYLHYDPYSVKKYGIQYLLRQRIDFLFLFPNSVRVVIEVDGKQHYSENDIPSPKKYAEMVPPVDEQK